MATLAQTLSARSRNLSAEATGWLKENIFPSVPTLLFNLALLGLAAVVFWDQFQETPTMASLIGAAWLVGLIMVIVGAVRHHFDPVSQWLKERLYNSAASALVTLVIVLWLAAAVRGLWNWAFADANFSTNSEAVAASEHAGATWGVIIANLKLFMVGQFANTELWRVWASVALVAGLIVLSVPVYGLYRERLRPFRRWLTWAWVLSPLLLYALLRGFGQASPLHRINTSTWGGLLLTLIITLFAIVVSFPLGILLALGRRSTVRGVPAWLTYSVVGAAAIWGLVTYTWPNLPLVRTPLEYVLIFWPLLLLVAGVAFQRAFRGNVVAAFSTVYIEFVRGVPLITVLFMANFLLPLFLPPGTIVENAFRAMWGFALFSAAYLAENVRGGLQAIPRGQYEAAQALGFSTFQQYRFIILPQALRIVIPPIVGQFIGLFKDTSLVAIVGLFDLLGIANAVVSQPDWLGLRREAYVFTSVIYYIGCFLIAAAGRGLEKREGLGQR
jgi:general L-amino acid transport system permease protein